MFLYTYRTEPGPNNIIVVDCVGTGSYPVQIIQEARACEYIEGQVNQG